MSFKGLIHELLEVPFSEFYHIIPLQDGDNLLVPDNLRFRDKQAHIHIHHPHLL